MNKMCNKKKTVLIVHNFYQIPGGEDTVVANEKRILEEHGHKVIMYTRSNSEMSDLRRIQRLVFPVSVIFNINVYREIKTIIKRENIEIVHVHNTLTMISQSVYYAAIKCGIPVVQTMHNFRLLCPSATFYRDGHICEDCVAHGLKCAIRHNCYRDSKLQTFACVINTKLHMITGIYKKINYICLTEFNKEKLLLINKKKEIIYENKIYIKPNFTFRDISCSTRILGQYYLFIGRIEKIKGIEIIVKAFSKLPNLELRIAGTGTELERLRLSTTSNIKFLGFVEHEKLFEIINNARAVIVASQWYETFGMIVTEAYSMGKPVIAGDIGNIATLVDDGKTGYKYKYDSYEALIETILKFESSEDVDWIQKTTNKYRRGFSPEINYKILNDIYNNVT